MSELTFQEEKLDTLLSDLEEYIYKHWEEAITYSDRIPFDPDWEMYRALERDEAIKMFTVRDGEELVGYFGVFLSTHLHCSTHTFATSHVLYVKEELRHQNIGTELISFSEKRLKDEGVTALILSVPHSIPFDKLYKDLNYSLAERVYMKFLGE